MGDNERTVTGWNKVGDDFYYFNYPGGSMTYDNTINGFDIDNDGKIVSGTGWLKDGYSGDWYHYSEGQMTKGWEQEGDNWYYLKDDGKMATGWEQIGGDWYYFHSDGTMATGWVDDGNGSYYLYSNGSMAWGKTVNGYHLDSSGKMVTGTGWQYIDGSWYYLKGDGTVATNWQCINDNWYYLYPEGSMAWNTTVDGYYLNKDGEWVPNAVGDSNDEINSLPEYDPLSARLNENKRTRAKKKNANGEYFAGTIDEFGNFIPDDIEGFSGILINRDESSFPYKAVNFGQGAFDELGKTLGDLKHSIEYSGDTIMGSARLLLDRDYATQAVIAMNEEEDEKYEREMINGDGNTRAYYGGEKFTDVALLFGGEYTMIGKAGEVSKAEKVAETARIAEEGSASDSYLYQKYKESLVKDDVLNNSEEIITGDKFGDKKLIAELTKDGSNIEDWSKMESNYSYTNEYGTGKIHYYMNVRTGKVSYYDAKMKISAPKSIRDSLKYTETDKDGFWIVDLDENLIPIGVR